MTDTSTPTISPGRPRVLPAVGAALVAGVGLVLLLSGIADSSPGLAITGALLLGLGVDGGVLQALRWVRAQRSSGAAVAGRTPDGLPVLSVVEPPATLRLAVAAVAWVALCAAAGAVLSFATGVWLLGVLLAVAAVGTVGFLVLPVTRGLRGARVELTPDWLAVERHGARVQVPWSDVSGGIAPLTPGRPVAVTLRAPTSPPRVGGWPGWSALPDTPPGLLPVPAEDLPVDPGALARVISACAADLDLRAQLGTPDSTDWTLWPPRPADRDRDR